ncbi:MAG TPA: hypothetical protein VGH49_20495, partial [Xanthobacteraceae bacterium]
MTRDRNDPAPGAHTSAHRAHTPEPDAGRGLDRRALLAAAGGAVVAGLGPAPTSAAPSGAATEGAAPAAPAGSVLRIDAHTHFSSLKFLDALEKQDGKPFVLSHMYRAKPALTEIGARLAILDRNEVDIHVLVPV